MDRPIWFPPFPALNFTVPTFGNSTRIVDKNNDKINPWKLDAISLLAVIGESAISPHIPVLTSSWLCTLPRILPAPQALLQPSHFTRLPQYNARVVGVETGILKHSLNYFPNILHPIDKLPRYAFKYYEITHKKSSVPTRETEPEIISDVETGANRPPRKTKLKRRITSTDKRPFKRIPTHKFSYLNLVTILSSICTGGLIGLALHVEDGVALLALGLLATVSTLVGLASKWEPILRSKPSINRGLTTHVVIKTHEEAIVLVKCSKEIAEELYFGTEECAYMFENRDFYRSLVAIGTIFLMFSIVMLGNCGTIMQIAIGASYIFLNGIFWGASLINPRRLWNISSIYKVKDITPEKSENAHLPQGSDINNLESQPDLTRTLWYAIRETKDVRWVKKAVAAPDTTRWEEWLQSALHNALTGNFNWTAVRARENIGDVILDSSSPSNEGEIQAATPASTYSPWSRKSSNAR